MNVSLTTPDCLVYLGLLAGENLKQKQKTITFDLSIALTKTKYIKLNTKTQFFLTTFHFCINSLHRLKPNT